MNKVIWTCWFQGRKLAPPLVKKCLESWEQINPNWDFRCLDAQSIVKYIDLREHIDLKKQSITAASLSDIIRIHLLHEYGGVWVDATLFCNKPLDDWLPVLMQSGFFAFDAPAPDRPLASWFLAAESNNHLVDRWCARTRQYWKERKSSDDYFWFHHQFRSLCETDHTVRQDWAQVSKISASGPHSIQFQIGMYRPASETISLVDWSTPVFKLTYRLDEQKYQTGCLLDYLLKLGNNTQTQILPEQPSEQHSLMSFASLKVSTENLGDHIQIIAALHLLARLGIEPDFFIDRDNEIASLARLDQESQSIGILMNGWFKTNREEWPPHPNLSPIFLGFHTRLFQCPELISEVALKYYRRYEPIGCRDTFTTELLESKGINVFESNCLTLTFPLRLSNLDRQKEVFVVSRDEHLINQLPSSLSPNTFIRHYSGSTNFEDNMKEAYTLLETYRTRAKLIVTTLLHCALPAIAMGIPVVVFYPHNNDAGHASDRERFSTVEKMIRIYHFNEMDQVDWNPNTVDVSGHKLAILDHLYKLAERWQTPAAQMLDPIAPPSTLPAA